MSLDDSDKIKFKVGRRIGLIHSNDDFYDEVKLDQIKEFISAQSLKFLSLDGLYKAMGFEKRNDNYPQLTDHYFTGEYPVKIIDELGGDKVTQLSLLSTGSNN